MEKQLFYIGVPQKRQLLINVMVESIYLSGRLFELNYFGLKYANKYVNTSRFFKFSVLYKVLFGNTSVFKYIQLLRDQNYKELCNMGKVSTLL